MYFAQHCIVFSSGLVQIVLLWTLTVLENICVPIFLGYSRVQYLVKYFNINRYRQIVCSCIFPPAVIEVSSCSVSSLILGIFRLFYFGHSGRFVVVSHCVLICFNFLDDYWIEHIFIFIGHINILFS